MRKKAEYALKMVRYASQADGVSVTDPKAYATRFRDSMLDYIRVPQAVTVLQASAPARVLEQGIRPLPAAGPPLPASGPPPLPSTF
jgi:hypothetical protein